MTRGSYFSPLRFYNRTLAPRERKIEPLAPRVTKAENQNKIAINVFGFEEGDLFPANLNEEREYPIHENCLLFSERKKRTSYSLLKICFPVKQGTQLKCITARIACTGNSSGAVNHSDNDNVSSLIKDFQKKIRVPFVIYADFESLATVIQSERNKKLYPIGNGPIKRNFLVVPFRSN